VLEAGCGDGWNVAQFVKAGLRVVGCDWSEKGIHYARINSPTAELYCGDVRDSEFLRRFPEQFDAVALIEVIEHIPPDDTVEALRNLLGRLRVGGTFVLTTPHVNLPNTNPQHYRHFTPELLETVMEQVGGMGDYRFEPYGNIAADRAYWKRMRWVDNRFFSVKPLAERVRSAHRYDASVGWNDAHGIIMTATRFGDIGAGERAQ